MSDGILQEILGYAKEIERHLHQNHCSPTPLDSSRNAAASATADEFGDWVLLTSNAELVACGITTGLKFDAHYLSIRGATNNREIVVEIGYGDAVGSAIKYNGFTFTTDSIRSSAYEAPGRRITQTASGNLYYRMKGSGGSEVIAGAWPDVHWYEKVI